VTYMNFSLEVNGVVYSDQIVEQKEERIRLTTTMAREVTINNRRMDLNVETLHLEYINHTRSVIFITERC